MTTRPRTSRQEWYDQTAVRVAAAQELLASKLSELRSGQDWKRYLTFQSRLHHYSPNNATLIYFQHAHAYAAGLVSEPEPSYVAGYATWKALGRTVERGQHGYAILAPVAVLRSEASNPHGTVAGFTPGDSPNSDDTESVNWVVRGFKIEHVFDVSQTRGRPTPRPVVPKLLGGQAPKGLAGSMLRFIRSHGYRVDTVSSATEIDGANGVTNWSSRQVTVRNDMDEAAIAKTLAHEAAHILLHEKPPGQSLPRQLKEVEAESVAYVVTSAHGMASDDYSFPYIATWAGSDLDSALRATQTRVAAAAKTIIDSSSAAHHSGGCPSVESVTHRFGRSPSSAPATPGLEL
jgi:hypothetical protein